MQITNIGREEHRLLSTAINEALKEVGDKFGVTLRAAGGQTGSTRGRIFVDVRVSDLQAAKDAGKMEWDRLCGLIGLEPELYGKTFVAGRELFKITGINLSRHKYPVSAERVNDKRGFKFPTSTIRMNFPKKAAA